jgi:3-hydroxybutyryl-CoA dehydrogenase
VKFEEIKKVGILGGGVMGGGIAQTLVLAGYTVVIRDLNDEVNEATRETVNDGKWGIKRAVERGKVSFDEGLAAMARVSFTTKPADLADCDLVIEAVPEKLELKQQVFAEMDAVMKPTAILASNTSGFAIADLARDVSPARQALFVGMHYSNPVPTMKMLEVIYTPETSQDTIEAATKIGEATGKVVSLVKDAPGTYGFLLNRIFGAAYREAKAIVDAGIATPEDIDKAMMTGRNWPSGFFGGRGGIGKQW